MIYINVYETFPIDIQSQSFREKMADSVKQYVLEHWDECVSIKQKYYAQNNNGYHVVSMTFSL